MIGARSCSPLESNVRLVFLPVLIVIGLQRWRAAWGSPCDPDRFRAVVSTVSSSASVRARTHRRRLRGLLVVGWTARCLGAA